MKLFGLGYPAIVENVAKHDVTTAFLLEDIGQWSFLPRAFQAMIVDACGPNTSAEALNHLLVCIKNKTFYAEAIVCGSGQIALGCTDIDGINLPCVLTTALEAYENVAEGQQLYADDIEEGIRDDDDEYEGEAFIVKWDGGETIAFADMSGNEIPVSDDKWLSLIHISEPTS